MEFLLIAVRLLLKALNIWNGLGTATDCHCDLALPASPRHFLLDVLTLLPGSCPLQMLPTQQGSCLRVLGRPCDATQMQRLVSTEVCAWTPYLGELVFTGSVNCRSCCFSAQLLPIPQAS